MSQVRLGGESHGVLKTACLILRNASLKAFNGMERTGEEEVRRGRCTQRHDLLSVVELVAEHELAYGERRGRAVGKVKGPLHSIAGSAERSGESARDVILRVTRRGIGMDPLRSVVVLQVSAPE